MSRLARARELRSGITDPEDWLARIFQGGHETTSGSVVTTDSAMRHADVWACVRAISDEVASCPLIHYTRTGDRSRKRTQVFPGQAAWALSHPFPGIITGSAFWGLVAAHLNTRGNSFSKKLRNNQTQVVERLLPIAPSRVTVKIAEGGKVVYTVTAQENSGVAAGDYSTLEILHFKGLSLDGLMGLGPISQAREAIGLGISQEEYAARVFRNDATPRGVLYTKKLASLNDEAKRRLKAQWKSIHSAENQGELALLDIDADKFEPLTMSPADLGFIDQRRFSTNQIARIFRVPPWVIGASSGDPLTYKTVEGQQMAFAMSAIRPWLVNIESTLRDDPDFYPDDGSTFGEFLMDAMLRADSSSRAQNNSLAVGRWKTPNEIRREEGDPDIEGGDELKPMTPPPAPVPPEDPNPDDGAKP